MSGITNKPAFWVAFALFSLISAMLAWRYFPEALPLINRMRNAAIEFMPPGQ